MKGRLFGVGVGPGDPSLMTLKAAETLRKADVVAAPDTGGEKTALNVAADCIVGKELLLCPLPMTRDEKKLAESRDKSAELICEKLENGLDVAFVTLGDPSVYSTYTYLHRLVKKKGYEAEVIPGVPSFCAAAAALGVPLCEGGEALHVFPASYEGLSEGLCQKGTKVLMKSGRRLGEAKRLLSEAGLKENVYLVERCGMEGERVCRDLEDAGDAGYFSIILVKDED